ncbi:tripartite-type tricarboxylate transporter receptor subunit TctC [Sporomusaceae bacterium BoRhaA]|nr:tripartite-type tricarboxylate transporter receptor subunit TctC [Pelorhabdus rhamnosifermentans]
MRRKPLFLLAAFLLISIMIGGYTSMQSSTVIKPKVEKYPDKPITLIVPWSVGTAADLTARILEKSALKDLGQPLTIVNKPGGTTTIGLNELASSNPDGYTIGLSTSELFLQPLFVSTKYDYSTALEPLAQITSTPYVMAVQTNQPWQSVDDLISYAKQHPGQLKFGHAGTGSIPHIMGETFTKKTGIIMNQVPFQGSVEVMAALLGGHVQVIFTNPGVIKEQMKNGTVRILAVAGKYRLTGSLFTNIPTFKEQGIDIVYGVKMGIAVPKETPLDVKAKLSEGLKAIINAPEFKKDIENIGLQYEYLGPEESQTQWLVENKELTAAVQETGIVDLIKSQKQ